jgi:energy-coupling factor transporter ATP-binding protein EcfA2
MNVCIIGPEGSGKTTLATTLAKKVAHGRPVYVMGMLRSKYLNITDEQFKTAKNCICIVDDANAYLDGYELNRKNSPFRSPVIMSRHWNRVNFFVFHSIDDAVKFMFRLSRYIYISKKYRDTAYKNNKFIKGISPTEVGRKTFLFLEYARY